MWKVNLLWKISNIPSGFLDDLVRDKTHTNTLLWKFRWLEKEDKSVRKNVSLPIQYANKSLNSPQNENFCFIFLVTTSSQGYCFILTISITL